MLFIHGEIIVTYVDIDGGIIFYLETLTKIRQISQERNYISRSFEKPECIPSNDQYIRSIDEQRTSYIFLNPDILWDMVPAALISLRQTNGRDSMSNEYTQPTAHQPRTLSNPLFASLRLMCSKRKQLRFSFSIFQRNYRPDGRVKETFAKVEDLGDLWKPGAMDGFPLFVMNCICI